MFKSVSPEKRHVLKEKIDQQRRSNQPIRRWCKENGISIGQFYYWKEQFFPRSIHRSEFLELNQPENVGIKVECKGIHIHLEPYFDAPTFKRCLSILRELPC